MMRAAYWHLVRLALRVARVALGLAEDYSGRAGLQDDDRTAVAFARVYTEQTSDGIRRGAA